MGWERGWNSGSNWDNKWEVGQVGRIGKKIFLWYPKKKLQGKLHWRTTVFGNIWMFGRTMSRGWRSENRRLCRDWAAWFIFRAAVATATAAAAFAFAATFGGTLLWGFWNQIDFTLGILSVKDQDLNIYDFIWIEISGHKKHRSNRFSNGDWKCGDKTYKRIITCETGI